jgi:hypothetical protein
MEVRTQSKGGPVVSPLPQLVAQVSREIQCRQQEWLQQLREDPGRFAHLEHKVHQTFQQLADQVVAGLLAEASAQSPALEEAKKKF